MEMDIRLHDGGRVDARYDDRVLVTDQDGSAPAPFDLFLASIGTCAGFYVARFCESRGIPTEGIRIRQTAVRDSETRMVTAIDIAVDLPATFPPRYADAVVRAAGACSVKKHLARPPEIRVAAVVTA
jgi:ribosomal protein S12 methylthiotransferase accessory factor